MNRLMEQLISLVEEQKHGYDALLTLSRQKQEAIVAGDVARLDQIVQDESLLLASISELERQRRQVVSAAAAEQNLSGQELTLAGWPDVDAGQKDRIDTLQSAFRTILEEIEAVNTVNTQLLNRHLGYVQQMIDTVTRTRENRSYDADGSLDLRREQAIKLIDAVL